MDLSLLEKHTGVPECISKSDSGDGQRPDRGRGRKKKKDKKRKADRKEKTDSEVPKKKKKVEKELSEVKDLLEDVGGMHVNSDIDSDTDDQVGVSTLS